MNQEILTPVLDWLDLIGIGIFALTGALVAAREQQTFVTMGFFALVTGVGGGTVRDLLIGAPVFWIGHPWVAAVCLGTALLTCRVCESSLFFSQRSATNSIHHGEKRPPAGHRQAERRRQARS